jgi:hypothetical protein
MKKGDKYKTMSGVIITVDDIHVINGVTEYILCAGKLIFKANEKTIKRDSKFWTKIN